MVDVQFVRRLPRFVPLAVLQYIGTAPQKGETLGATSEDDGDEDSADKRESMIPPYLTAEDIKAIAGMQLLNRGRLSVQYVEQIAFDAIVRLGDDEHDWDAARIQSAKSKAKIGGARKKSAPVGKGKKKKRKMADTDASAELVDSYVSHFRESGTSVKLLTSAVVIDLAMKM